VAATTPETENKEPELNDLELLVDTTSKDTEQDKEDKEMLDPAATSTKDATR
jgi:hypothetical protein